jgi:hypothetical protein
VNINYIIMLRIINLTFILGCGVLFGTSLTEYAAKAPVKGVGNVAPVGCRASTTVASEADVYNIRVSESVQAKSKGNSKCSPVAATAEASTSTSQATTLGAFIENLQFSLTGEKSADRPASCVPVNSKPQNCKPADCKPVNCDPSNCDPKNCDISQCKSANSKPAC